MTTIHYISCRMRISLIKEALSDMPGYTWDKNLLGLNMKSHLLYSRQGNISYSLFLLFPTDFTFKEEKWEVSSSKAWSIWWRCRHYRTCLRMSFWETDTSLCHFLKFISAISASVPVYGTETKTTAWYMKVTGPSPDLWQ